MSRFFIERPIFAWVIAIILMLGGGLSLLSLPIAQYPPIAPPTISVTAEYPGASAETAQSTVGQVIEQQLSGLDHLLYFTSQSGKDGSVQISLSFAQGTDPDIAQVQVQNKLQLAMPRLPEAVQLEGVTVAKATKNFLMIVGFISTDGSMNSFDLSDFIASDIEDPISRTRGVGGYELFGSEYAMRIWLDPAKLYKYSLTPTDVSAAIQSQNVQLSSGELGGLPSVRGQELNATIIGPSYLQTPEDFGNILLKVSASGARVRLHDVAKVEIAAEQYSPTAKYNGQPASAIAVNLAAGANALATVDAVKATIKSLQSNLPARCGRELPLRHLTLRSPVGGGGDQDARHRGRARLPYHFCVPSEFPCDPDPYHRSSCRAARHVRRAGGGGLFAQLSHPVRHGARHWPAGRRRHRCGRECRARHGGG